MQYRKQLNVAFLAFLGILAALAGTVASCGPGGSGAGNPMIVQSAPLSGPNAAFQLEKPFDLFDRLFMIPRAFAAVSSFVEFKACNDTMEFIDGQGNTISIAGTSSPGVGAGLLNFDPNQTSPMTIGSLAIPAGTTISEIDITFAVVPNLCQGANYAVEFNDGTDGVKDITQNTAFKFPFSNGGITVGSSQTVTLMFGKIVNGMVSLGASLNNSTIQTVNVGQAQ